MSSPVTGEDRSNTKTEEGTTAFHKKRSRRVSFAENTSVHIFDRDESGSSPDPAPSNSSNEDLLGFADHDSDSKQFFRTEEEDDDEDDDLDELGPRSPFIRVVASPSSGGSTIGSATSNDEDNFFGPVSASFIRRDLSDSAVSDDHHDQTMDSTSFSMHYRSIARSDSEGEMKTSTQVHLSFEEKTPTPRSIDSNTSSMLLTLANKPNSQPDVSTSKLSSGSQSNDMSLVGKYREKYDYGKLSPALNSLLAEGDRDLHAASNVSSLKSPIKAGKQFLANKENESDLMEFSYGQDNKIEGITSHEELNEVVSVNHNEMGVGEYGSNLFLSEQIAFGVFPNTSDTQASKSLSPNQSTKGTLTGTNSSLEFLATSQGTPSNSGNIVYQLDDAMEKENKFPLIGSIAHSTDRPSYMLLNGVSLLKSPATMTPSHNQTIVFPRTNSLQHGGSVSSLRKSISKLRILEASPFSAALNAKLENSNFKSLVGFSKMTPLCTLLEKNSKSPQVDSMNHGGIETMDICLVKPLPSSAKKREGVSTNMDDNKTEILKNSVCITRNENFVEVEAQLGLPSEIASGEQMQPTEFKSADIGYGDKNDESKIGSSQTFHCSSPKLKKERTTKFRFSPYRAEEQPVQHNESSNFGLDQVGGLEENISNTGLLITSSNVMDSLYVKGRETFTPLNVEGSNIEEIMHAKQGFLKDVSCNSKTRGMLTTLLNDIEHENSESIIRRSDISTFSQKSSLIINGRKDERSCRKNLADQFGRSPSNKELCSMLHNDNIDSVHAENVQSSCANQFSNGDAIAAERKRKSEDAIPTEKIAKIKTSSNSGFELPSGSGMSSIGPNLEHLAQIQTRFFKETKLLPHSVDKMNLHAIDRVIDTLGQLQMSKTYQLLSSKFQSQTMTIVDPSNDIQDKRTAEAKLLLCKIVHEQAKFQLMHVKRKKLLKNVQSLASGVQESEGLKLNLSSQNLQDAQVIRNWPFSDNIKDIQECQVDNDKVNSMRQMTKDIDGRISTLTKSFHVSCKMKGEPDPVDTIASVNDHLLKRARCQIIRKDMQLWVLNDLKSCKDHHDVILNYLNLMFQRITVTAGVIPIISFSHSLNQMNINKNFQDMDASTAFGFVFKAGLIHKHVGATSLAQETQMTSHLLGNLVDVMEEIQLARLELQNLINARFHTSLGEQLHLELYFFNANSRKKATVTLNTSCLKRGIYLSDIGACQIDIPENESQKPSTQTLSAQIAAAIKDLRVGYLRILRLCRCISLLVSQGKS